MKMTEGTKNTILAVLLSAVVGGMATEIGLTIAHGEHFVRIDSVLESQNEILKEIKNAKDIIPPIVEHSLGEVRARINMLEYRQAEEESKVPKK